MDISVIIASDPRLSISVISKTTSASVPLTA